MAEPYWEYDADVVSKVTLAFKLGIRNMFYSEQSSRIHSLFQPCGGLFKEIIRYRSEGDEPRFITQIARLGDVGQTWSHIRRKPEATQSGALIVGVGADLNEEQCFLPALAEGVERYCGSVYTSEQFIYATARELGAEALDLETIPRCSQTELTHPSCPLVVPDRKRPMRWVRGISLLDGRLVYLPVVMVFMFCGYANSGERIWMPNSSGCAAHISLERALLSAMLEVIERDAISILWLQKLSLPKIEIDYVPPALRSYWDEYQRGSAELEYLLLDATTDLGIPVVYGLQIARTNRRFTSLVSCSCVLDPVDAVIKVFRDAAACRIGFRNIRPIPESWNDFTNVFHGSSYMARSEQAHAFDFLLRSGNTRRLSDLSCAASSNEKKSPLEAVLEIFRRKQMEVFAVDLTTDEAMRAGLRVVRVITPGLQPLSFHYRAQYLGHPRLYDAPRQMNYPVYNEEHLNHWPQPFA